MSIAKSFDLNNAVVIVDFSQRDKNTDMLININTISLTNTITTKISGITILYSKIFSSLKKLLNINSSFAIIPPADALSMRGAGITYKSQEYITHSTLPFSLSAAKTLNYAQKVILLLLGLVIGISLFIQPIPALKALVAILSLMYFSDVVFNLIVVLKSLSAAKEISFSKTEIESIDESKLPIYTVLCPLYKEAHIFPQFLEAINKLDYPKDKLDILLLLEEDDKETIKILEKMTLPTYIKTITVPHSLPKTKPKACNYGLSFARGEYLVIYDAEDVPDPLQLKKAYLGFQTLPNDVQCLQAKLNYYNPRANLLTKFFTVEYALWFDIMLTGLQTFNSSLPLGGTSNHFKTERLKELHGWDPFNVTEDADLGVRLFQKGFRTAVIDSTTLEEATSNTRNWIRQRSRWLKGYMQTYFVHTRNYKDFIGQKGILHYVIFQLTVGGKILFILINPLMWIITVLYFTSYAFAGPFLESIYTPPVSYIAVISWIFGNFLFAYYYMIACGRKKDWDLMKYVFLIPLYWGMMSYAGIIALYQLISKPHYWEKTVHGAHLAVKQNGQKEKNIAPEPAINPKLMFIYQAVKAVKNNLMSIIRLFGTYNTPTDDKKENHVLIFNWRDTSHVYAGGAEVYIHELAKRWAEKGSRVTLFCGNDYKNKPENNMDGVEVIRRGGSYTVYLFGFLYYMFKFRGKVDLIIDCENGIPFFSPIYARVPVILLIHHVHQDVFRQFLRFPLRQIAEFLEGKVMPIMYKGKQIVTVSKSSMSEILNLGFADPKNIRIIPNGASQVVGTAIQKTSHPSLMYLGRLKKYKNVETAIKAFAKIIDEYQDAIFSIAGTGETFPKLQRLVKKLKIEDNVKFLGRISEQEKIEMYAQSWFVVQPSQIEGWGITVIEANTCRTPVIASRVNGLVDSVVDGTTGLLVPAKNIDQFAKAMKQLIQNPDYLKTLSENAYAWSKNFNWDESADQFRTLISESVQDGRRVRPAISTLVLKRKKEARSV